MKLSHLTIIFIIIILPFSIVSRIKTEDYFLTLRDQVRLNNVIDVATQDAIDTLIEKNDDFQMINFNERFDVTQDIAKESVKSFFRTLAVNFNLPYIEGQTESYFSTYVPAIAIIAYDGFYIYSIDEAGESGFAYHMSPKIPYSYVDEDTGAIVNFTLGNYVSVFMDGVYYQGELSDDFLEQSAEKYAIYSAAYNSAHGGGGYSALLKDLPSLTTDLSVIIYAYFDDPEPSRARFNKVPKFLVPQSSGDGHIPLTQDYGSGEEPSRFHKIRREVILKLVKETLQDEINSHESYAKVMGSMYDFNLPEIPDDDWTNSINDITVMSFIQGMQVGTTSYYNNYALGGSRIVETDYLYGTSGDSISNYHYSTCPTIEGFFNGGANSVDNIFINRIQAAQSGYYPCTECNP